jgi:fibronectin-binding autotransporter adhesin
VLDADLVFDATYGNRAIFSFGSGGTLTVNASNNGTLGAGYRQSGSMMVSDGVQVSSDIGNLAYGSGSTGTATVTGAGSLWKNWNSLYVGRSGNGTLTIDAAGQVSNTNGFLGYGTNSTGAAVVTGAGSKWTNSGALIIGYQGSGMITVADGGEIVAAELFASLSDLFGDGTITATQGGIVDADLVFDAAHGNQATASFGSGGTLTVQAAGGILGVGYRQNGSLIVADGVYISSSSGSLGGKSGSMGAATVTGAGSTWTNSGLLTIGGDGIGTLTVEAGGQVSSASGYLGSRFGSGTVRVTGAASTWTNSSVLRVGNFSFSHGELSIEAGGEVSSSGAYLGYGAGSTGAATVTGTDSQWTNISSLYVGLDGDAALSITSGGLVKSVGLTIDSDLDNDSFINMATGGMLALKGDADDSLAQFLGLVQGTDAIRYWNHALLQWSPLTAATFGTDYTLSYITTGDLTGYTLLTVGSGSTVGDYDGDGDVDGRDFLILQRNPGLGSVSDWQSAYSDNSELAASSASIPEPNAAVLAMGLILSVLSRRIAVSRP